MSQVYVSPESRDTGTGSLAIIILVIVISFLGIIAYNKGWFSMNRSNTTDSSTKIDITTPAPASDSTKTSAPTTFSEESRGMRF